MTPTTGARRDFTPHPGSVADRALAWLHLQPARAEISTAALAEAINTPAHQLSSSMEQARERGAVFARKKGGHVRSPLFWSLVDHSAKHASTGQVFWPAYGSQTPDGEAAIPRAKAGSLLTAVDSDNPITGSEHSRIDGDVPAAQAAALQRQRPRRDKSTGHEQGSQEAERAAVRTLTGRNATISLTGEVAIVAECGTVILFDAARGQQLRQFFAGAA